MLIDRERRCARLTSFLLGVAAACLFAVGLVCLGRTLGEVPSDQLQVDESPIRVGRLRPGETVAVSITLRNRSSKPVRLVGSGDVCTTWGCLAGKGLPAEIRPRSSREVPIELRTSRRGFSGEFSGLIVLYTDSPGNEQIPVPVTGRILQVQ
jgi:hypothetical protein